MEPDLLPLQEYQSTEVQLSLAELDHLLDLVKGATSEERRLFESITPTRRDGFYVLRPGGFVGRLGLPTGRAIDIRSRFSFADTLELIRLSGRLPTRADRLPVPSGTSPFLIEVIAQAFVRETDQLIALGLAKGYQRQQFDRPPYPGVPDVNVHLGRFAGRPDKLVTRAKRITRDIVVNQALARALDILLRLRTNPGLVRHLMGISSAFAQVGRPPIGVEQISRISLDRFTSRYRDALVLAELVLRGQTLGPRSDSSAGASIVFDMARVWEGYVARWARSTWGENFDLAEQFGFDVTRDGSFRGYADVMVREGDRVVALYDAKYKRLVDKPATGDIYQMVTYCTRLGIDEATLVYPAPAPALSFVIEGITIRTFGLEVGAKMELAT